MPASQTPPPQQYQQPGTPMPGAQPGWGPQPKNGLGTAALVLGILALLGAFIPILGMLSVPLALIGLVLGILGFLRVRKGQATNKGAAIAGIILSIHSFVVVGAVTAMTGAAIDSVDKAVNATPSNAAPAAKSGDASAEPSNTAKVGEALTYDSMGTTAKIAVLKVVDNAESDNEFTKPGDGKRYVAVQLAAENVGSATYNNLTWLDSKIYGTSGQGYTNSFAKYKGGPEMPTAIDLKPGGKVNGWMLFEVPTTDKLKTVEIDNGVWQLP